MKLRRWILPSITWLLVLQACGEIAIVPEPSEPARDAATAPFPDDVADAESTDVRAPVDAAASRRLADYDQSCTSNRDCALTFSGPCEDGACWCTNAAINHSALSEYTLALLDDAASRGCSSMPARRCGSKCPADLRPLCIDQRCVVASAPAPLDLSGYDRSCNTVEDCAIVSTDLCYCEPCARDAINRNAIAQYQADIALLPACGTREPCDSNEPCYFGSVSCEAGRCGYQVTSGPP